MEETVKPPWKCCRTCLSVDNLNEIFYKPDKHEVYTSLIFQTVGIMVRINDGLPQLMCKKCINIINECYEFRSKCARIQRSLDKFKNDVGSTETFDNKYMATVTDKVKVALNGNTKESESIDKIEASVVRDKNLKSFKMNVQEVINKKYNIKIKNKTDFDRVVLKYASIREDIKRKTNEIILKCKYCGDIFTNKVKLYNHYKVHQEKKVICEHCSKKFRSKLRLLMHCRAKHGYEKVNKCSYCDYKGSNAELVKIHERLHTGEKPYVCGDCGADFHRRSCYLQHLPIHLQSKTVQCIECPALFKSVTLMKIHRNRHKKRREKKLPS